MTLERGITSEYTEEKRQCFSVLVSLLDIILAVLTAVLFMKNTVLLVKDKLKKSFHTIYLYVYVFHFQKYVVIYLEKVNKTKDLDNMTPSFYHHL